MKLGCKKPIDCFVFKVKARDFENFRQNSFCSMVFSRFVKQKPDIFVFENPQFRTYKENAEKMATLHWSVPFLQHKGFNVTSPKCPNPDDVINVYLLKTQKIRDAYDGRSKGIMAKIRHLADLSRTGMSVRKLFKAFEGNKTIGALDNDAVNFLTMHEMNKYATKHFENFVNKFNVREIEYVPKKSESAYVSTRN